MVETRSCNLDNNCLGGIFLVRNNSYTIFDCCDSNFCNSDMNSYSKLSYECEFNKAINKTKQKLIYPISLSSNSSVSKCYYCKSCVNFKSAKVIHCGEKLDNYTKFACYVLNLKI